ncbi:OmpA family protein [Halovulum sp. GXIMD14794]|jgi:outer membrane protein OmpA-like peptidoglycan-associated protein
MKTLLKTTTILGVMAALAGCSKEAGLLPGATSTYGTATTSNLLAQAVSLQGNLLAELQAQFRASAPDMINFEFNQATLDANARAALDQQAAWIRANPAIKFRVYGHTDLVGSSGYNQRLGLRRAQAAVNYLIARGVRKGQVEAVASLGETRPLIATPNPERLNRRTVTQIVGFDRRFMGYDFDGKVAHNIYQDYVSAGE